MVQHGKIIIVLSFDIYITAQPAVLAGQALEVFQHCHSKLISIFPMLCSPYERFSRGIYLGVVTCLAAAVDWSFARYLAVSATLCILEYSLVVYRTTRGAK